MARRGENQFVAMEVNLIRDPKLKGMARSLRISRTEALGVVLLWRELVLTRGGGSGVVRGYSRNEIAEYLEWTRPASSVIGALRVAGYLVHRRGSLAYPGWVDTVTGYYANRRARDRARKAGGTQDGEIADGNLHGHSAEVPRNEHGTSAPIPARSVHKERKDSAEPPGAPQRGEEGREARWAWWLENYPKPRDPARTTAILAALSSDDWDLVKFSVPHLSRIYLFARTPRRVPNGVKFLETAWYLDSKAEWLRTKAEKAGPKKVAAPAQSPEELEREARAHAARFVVEQLADVDTPADRHPAIKAEWLRRWGGPPPWEERRATDGATQPN